MLVYTKLYLLCYNIKQYNVIANFNQRKIYTQTPYTYGE